MDRNYLNEPLADQLLGNTCVVSPFSAAVLREHKRLIQEGDGFATVSVHYPDERYELRAHAQHRYQWIVNEAVQHLRLPVWHLKHQKIWFNFYGELVRRFGTGTQGYTTETELPHIGVSEISLREPEVLQMVLLHEAQHATDYAFYDGFAMAVSERELRARLTVSQAIKAAKGASHVLFQTAAFDAAQWFLLFCLSRATDDNLRAYYYTDLDPAIQRLLRRGIRFTTAALIILQPELEREQLQLISDCPYAVSMEGGRIRVRGDGTAYGERRTADGEADAADRESETADGGRRTAEEGADGAPEGKAEEQEAEVAGESRSPDLDSGIRAEQAASQAPPPDTSPSDDECSSRPPSAVRRPPDEEVPTSDQSGHVDYYPGMEGRSPAERAAEAVEIGRGQEPHTLNNIDDWYNFPVIHQQLTERALTITDAWAKYEIDPSVPLPLPPPLPTPVFRTHQDLLRYKTGTGRLPQLPKQPK